jgi:cysteine desulfuration protein SufE
MTQDVSQSFARIVEDFSYLDEWEDRYRHVIELGKALPEMPAALKTPATKVSGCASQVWIHSTVADHPTEPSLALTGDSDALIVKGLMAIVFALFQGLPLSAIVATDAQAMLGKLGLSEHLTPQRSNGLASMIRRIKADAAGALRQA